MAQRRFLSETTYRVLSWLFTILAIFAVFVLVYVIKAPHKVESEIVQKENMLSCQDNMYRIALAEEKYYLDNGEYTTKKVYLLKYDEDADALRCPTTGILYEINLEAVDPDYTLDNSALAKLQEDKVPSKIRKKLGDLTEQTFNGKDAFSAALQGVLTEEELTEYQFPIMKATESEPDTAYSLECPRPEIGEYADHGSITAGHPSWKANRLVLSSYKLTKTSLKAIEKENDIPDSTMEKLGNLEDKEFKGQYAFLEAVKKTIGNEEAIPLKAAILNNAVTRTFNKED